MKMKCVWNGEYDCENEDVLAVLVLSGLMRTMEFRTQFYESFWYALNIPNNIIFSMDAAVLQGFEWHGLLKSWQMQNVKEMTTKLEYLKWYF